MIRNLPFASCYVYSPSGTGVVCERSRLLCALLKEGDTHFLIKYAARVHQLAEASAQLAGFFHAADFLVPVPGSTPRPARSAWVAADLADALVREGLGSVAWPGLHRIHAVRKSATATPGTRPTVARHYESFEVQRSQLAPPSVVLIDDVITKGRTLLAAAARVHEAFPQAQVRAFAMLRTVGLSSGLRRLLEPCRGEIRWKAGDAHRSP
jgi:predicted amidophosphoribosyltransferase